jgi:CheY-like chemotaxis protein
MAAKLLIVDDDPLMLAFLREKLQNLAGEIYEARTGMQAVWMVLEKLPDVIVLDVDLPERSGYEVCSLLKGNPICRHLPIVLITAHDQSVHVPMSGAVGADAFLAKPFTAEALRSTVGALLKKPLA